MLIFVLHAADGHTGAVGEVVAPPHIIVETLKLPEPALRRTTLCGRPEAGYLSRAGKAPVFTSVTTRKSIEFGVIGSITSILPAGGGFQKFGNQAAGPVSGFVNLRFIHTTKYLQDFPFFIRWQMPAGGTSRFRGFKVV